MACLNLNKFDKIVVADIGGYFLEMKGIWNLNFTVLQLTQHNYKLKENYAWHKLKPCQLGVSPELVCSYFFIAMKTFPLGNKF